MERKDTLTTISITEEDFSKYPWCRLECDFKPYTYNTPKGGVKLTKVFNTVYFTGTDSQLAQFEEFFYGGRL